MTTILETDPQELINRAVGAVRQAEACGADQAEVYLWQGRSLEVLHARGRMSLEEADQSGCSVRALVDGRLVFTKTSGLREQDLAWASRTAVASAKQLPRHGTLDRFPDPAPVSPGPTPLHQALVDPDPGRLVSTISEVQTAVDASGLEDYHIARLASHHGRFAVANSCGVATWDQHAHEGLHFQVRSDQGGTHKFSRKVVFDREPLGEKHDLGRAAEDAIGRARAATRPGRLDAAVQEAILDPPCAAQLVQKLSGSFIGRAAEQGRTAFAGKLGKQVADAALTLVDRPQGPGGCRAQRVDDEGTPTRERTLVQDGVLQGFLYDWIGSLETGHPPTGNGLRPLKGRYGAQPAAKPANLQVEPGDASEDEMVEQAEHAVFVQDAFLGDFTMDILTGDFSFVAPMAHEVESGRLVQPLVSTSIAGNLFKALQNIKALGREPVRFPGGSYVAMHLEGVTCST